VLVRAGLRSASKNDKDRAGSIAFFTFLSLFPLLLGLTALASRVLRGEGAREQVNQWVLEFFPVGADFVTQNVDTLVRLRGAAGVAGAAVLLWSARKMVGAISRGINDALGLQRDHAALLSPVRNFFIVVGVALLMFSTTSLSPLVELLLSLELPGPGGHEGGLPPRVTAGVLGVLSTGAMIGFTYLLIPYERPDWSGLWPGLLTATVLVEAGKRLFVLYVDNADKLDAVYGSISTVIVLMLWLYFFGRVLLFGAHVNAVRYASA